MQVAQTRAARELEEINEAQQIYKEDQLKAFKDQLADLETEIAIEEAVTEEKENSSVWSKRSERSEEKRAYGRSEK